MIESDHTEDNNYYDDYYPILITKDSNLQLPLSLPQSLVMNLAKWKDQRLELIDIPKRLIEVLQNTGFTVEKILDCGPSHIAEILKIDEHIGEIIYQETKKTTRNIISNSNY
ncbi:MAG TPA: hypothetical protein VFM31_00770 [Nitrososphaeraceae archaeon]|nr:hypothetical protein [Nitrososphaeraceae archaeon]